MQTTPDSIAELRERVGSYGTLVGFNAKYDIHVFRKIGLDLTGYTWWDCQLAEFIISRQSIRYPSLSGALERIGISGKLDVVANEYWDKGIQTEDVPWPILEDYARVDAEQTLALYHHQLEEMTPAQIKLCKLQCMDLLVLEEMEWNGLTFNEELCKQRAIEITEEIRTITDQLSRVYPNVNINFNSGDDLSAFLYGGTIVESAKEHIGFFKSGQKAGQPKYRNIEIPHELPRLVTPIRGSELKKQGYFATNQDTLLKLKAPKATKGIIELIQRQTRLGTLLSKTYEGLIKANREGYWEPGMLHGQYNQCVAQTGRLSSSAPNLQNLDSAAADLFVSRYDH